MLFCQNHSLIKNNKFEFNDSQHFLTRLLKALYVKIKKTDVRASLKVELLLIS